jgi:hypothetical protein
VVSILLRAGARHVPGFAAAASAAALALPALVQAAVNRPFNTPSGKIACAYIHYPELEPPLGPAIRCDLLFLNDRAVFLGTSGKARKIHVTDAVGNPRAKKLAYGTSKSFGRFTCTSRTTGLTCRNRNNGHGFSVSRESQKVF